MKILKTLFITLIITLLFVPLTAKAETVNNVNLYLFYGRECPHCEKLQIELKKIEKEYSNLKVYKYEVWHDQSNAQLFKKVSDKLDVPGSGVPYTVIGNQVLVGFSKGETDVKIKKYINYYSANKVVDKVAPIVFSKKASNENIIKEKPQDINSTFKLPILGKVDAKSASLPLIAIVIGIIDGFNPCSMWILLFLISMMFGMENRKRMWILGISFLVTSAAAYLMFMLSILSLTTFINSISYIKVGIALIAIAGGVINIRSYLKKKEDGCEVVDDKKRKKIISKVQKFTTERNFFLALIGVMTLAVSVNLIELACSAGFPVVFMQILAINEVNSVQAVVYVFLYILFFLIDDIIVFAIAMKTFELKAVSTKYGKFSHLIGGVLMIIIGLLLIFKPAWLMFNF